MLDLALAFGLFVVDFIILEVELDLVLVDVRVVLILAMVQAKRRETEQESLMVETKVDDHLHHIAYNSSNLRLISVLFSIAGRSDCGPDDAEIVALTVSALSMRLWLWFLPVFAAPVALSLLYGRQRCDAAAFAALWLLAVGFGAGLRCFVAVVSFISYSPIYGRDSDLSRTCKDLCARQCDGQPLSCTTLYVTMLANIFSNRQHST